MWICYAGSTALGESSCYHKAQEVRGSFFSIAVGRHVPILRYALLQRLVDEEADHGLGDSGVGRSEAPVKASYTFGPVYVARALQCVHLLLASCPGGKAVNQQILHRIGLNQVMLLVWTVWNRKQLPNDLTNRVDQIWSSRAGHIC